MCGADLRLRSSTDPGRRRGHERSLAAIRRQVYESSPGCRGAMLVEKVVAPPLDNNAYLIVDETSKQAAVVDPALGSQQLLAKADELGVKIVLILNTHGHVDATADDASIRTATGAKIAIFEFDAPRLEKNARDTRR